MPSNDPRPSKAERRDEARVKAIQMREQQKQREKRNRIIAISGLVAAVVVLVVVVALILGQTKGTTAGAAAYTGDAVKLADVAKPSTASDSGAIPVGATGTAGEKAATGDVVVSVYLDYMCPYCHQFETANDAELATLRAAGGVVVEYHPISILDRLSSGTEYSTRASNAAAVVADQAPDKFTAFNSALFANQPAENSKGLSDDEIAKLALTAGVPQTVVDQFTTNVPDKAWRTFAPYVSALTAQASVDLGDSYGTPTVLINGTAFKGDLYSAGPLTEAIVAAKG
ncbi:disulfide bond formation protein DsbA [Cellulomonas sp. WB94]|uniref:DsbA family protein n=1 Tax=Cellulomonas sp. WB94 TaxID=2173174 RepID=UPI000D578675|nr:thioredoxin domain-containing protein [Cellulomonas sp. WB94]PVU83344.1 disulfide bond formation protein DsbA [Cellulomonas sp. WB94]